MRYLLLFFTGVMLFACNSNEECKERELSHSEMYQNALQAKFLPKDIVYNLREGSVVHSDSLCKLPQNWDSINL